MQRSLPCTKDMFFYCHCLAVLVAMPTLKFTWTYNGKSGNGQFLVSQLSFFINE